MNDPQPVIDIHAPSRLHFGLLSFGDPDSPHQFGGVGAMIRSPEIHLRATPGGLFAAAGKHSGRVEQFARAIADRLALPSLPGCQLEVLAAPRQHVGLGVGTQLGMAVAAALLKWRGEPADDAAHLAQLAGRGKRSSIGAHGFLHGGLIVDSGHSRAEQLGRVEAHCRLPDTWRFLLAIDTREEGLAQKAERDAFAKLPPVPAATTMRLHALAMDNLVPAAQSGNYDQFAAALYHYGHLAGQCFATVQGGSYASGAIAQRVALIRSLGFPGCGQSSWGPTVFAITPSADAADELAGNLIREELMAGCELLIAEPANSGAELG